MSEKPQSSTRIEAPDVVRITEAAKLLGVSVRTVQRRLDSGELEAVCEGDTRRVRLPDVSRDMTRQNDAPEHDTRRDTTHDNKDSRSFEGDNTRQSDTTHDTTERHVVTRHGATEDDSQRDMMRELLAEKDARIVDLRSQVEAANRQAAEATAALREYLKMQAKALPVGESSTRNVVVETFQNEPQAPQIAEVNKETTETKNAAQSDARGEGLRELRAILRKLFGGR